MAPRISFEYRFFPVGQGLFSSGSLTKWSGTDFPRRSVEFLWVYDCGTSSSPQLVDDGIKELAKSTNSQRIDVLFLSHFDHDHISGVCKLLGQFEVGILVLPFMPLDQRILLAFEEGAEAGDELMSFMINPVAYLAQRAEKGIGEILFLAGSGDEGPPFNQEVEPAGGEGDPNAREDLWNVSIRRREPNNTDEAEARAAGEAISAQVSFFEEGSSIVVNKLWEFVPFNDDPGIVIDESFRKQVENRRADLFTAADSQRREKALKELKNTYDKKFGRSSHERNVISLFVYSGPLYAPGRPRFLHRLPWRYLRVEPLLKSLKRDPPPQDRDPRERCSIIYTGDGYLDTPAALSRLTGFWSASRMAHCGVLQVMHHGAEGNWHKGVATATKPLVSVFSSNPERKGWGHPHAAVLRDFWRFGPVQVDKVSGFRIHGFLQ